MALFGITPARETRGEDPWRLHCAAHELGHQIVWTTLGFTVRSTTITGGGSNVEGTTRLANESKNLHSPQRCHDYLVGLLAGREADILWARHAGRPFQERHSVEDLRAYRKIRRHEWAKGTSDRQFRGEATRLVRAHWKRIVQLTPQLAQHGCI